MIDDLHRIGVKVFADLKLNDIPSTIRVNVEMLAEARPEIVTVMGCAGVKGIKAVKEVLGDSTEVLVVTVLTSLDDDECQEIFGCSTNDGVIKFAKMAQLAGADGLILSPAEIKMLEGEKTTLSLNAPNFRPEWDQNPDRSSTIIETFKSGLNRAVMERAIINAENPREAVMLTLEEIEEGLALRKVDA